MITYPNIFLLYLRAINISFFYYSIVHSCMYYNSAMNK